MLRKRLFVGLALIFGTGLVSIATSMAVDLSEPGVGTALLIVLGCLQVYGWGLVLWAGGTIVWRAMGDR